ncbi:MAG: hypothetical protein ACO27B_07025, partial [Ilumatobacteraceae bacterium]
MQMKSERTFWLSAAAAYTVAWGWSFLFANAYFWDDWASFFGKTADEAFDLGYYDEKHFLNPVINSFLLNFGIWAFRLAIFALMFGAGVFAYKIILRSKMFSVTQCRLFALVFLLLPVNHARFSIQTFEYSFAYFFFFLGWYLVLLRKPVWRIFALLSFLIAIGTPSFLTFMILPLINLYLMDLPRGRQQIAKWLVRNADICLLVIVFALFFRTSQGDVEKYGASSYGILYSFSLGLAFAIFVFVNLRRRKANAQPMRSHILIFSSIALVWLGTVPYWIVGYDPARGLPDVFQLHAGARIQAGEFFTLSMSVLKLVGGIVIGLLVLFVIKKKSRHSGLIIPNIFFVLYLLNNHFVGPLEWDSRLQLLWPLGLALLAVAMIDFVPAGLRQKNANLLVVVLTAATALISAEYYVDSLKQEAIIEQVKQDVQDLDGRTVLVSEFKNKLNARERTYRVGEWSGIVNKALVGDDNVIKTFIALKDDQSCPVSYRGVALYPRVKSSFLESLFSRRVDVELGRINLPVTAPGPAIRACPER